ncbi:MULTISPECIES: hypothetical protein [unclassified Methylobacterium]|nr:hypothetical protein [Methylobacterium sp. 4-46]
MNGARNGRVHAMRDHVRSLAAGRDNVRLHTVHEAPDAQDRAGEDSTGRA